MFQCSAALKITSLQMILQGVIFIFHHRFRNRLVLKIKIFLLIMKTHFHILKTQMLDTAFNLKSFLISILSSLPDMRMGVVKIPNIKMQIAFKEELKLIRLSLLLRLIGMLPVLFFSQHCEIITLMERDPFPF